MPSNTTSTSTSNTAVASTASTTPATELTLMEQITSDFASLNERLAQFKTMYTSIATDLRKLQKNMTQHMKETNKKKKRKTTASDKPRAPSGFAKPTLISVEMCSFLGQPEGTEMARTEVTKHLNTYIKKHELQDLANRRKIIPDKALKKLLNITASDELTYFNLQKYMKVHFPKSAANIASAATNAAATNAAATNAAATNAAATNAATSTA
jgi:chromatin remodeling complex protein RSC6